MSEQAPRSEDTPAVAGPEGTPGTAEQTQAEIDWHDRYVNLQPEYTRATQEAAELRQRDELYQLMLTSEDQDTRRQAAEVLGFQLAEDEASEPAEYEDPYEQLLERQNRIEQRLDQSAQSAKDAEEQALIQAISAERLDALEGVDKEDQDLILAYAINALPALYEQGVPVPLPDIQGAYEYFLAREDARQRKWASTKRAPYVPPGGQPANEVPNLDTHQGRVDYALQKLAENQST